MAGKTTKTRRAVKQRGNSAKKAPVGKPFEKGNSYAFRPGQSGNPKGRPRARTLSEAYRAWLSLPSKKNSKWTNADMVAEAIGKQALAGNIGAAQEMADRIEGRPRQSVELKGDERKREMVSRAIAALVEQAQISRDEAIDQLTAIAPEMSEWIN